MVNYSSTTGMVGAHTKNSGACLFSPCRRWVGGWEEEGRGNKQASRWTTEELFRSSCTHRRCCSVCVVCSVCSLFRHSCAIQRWRNRGQPMPTNVYVPYSNALWLVVLKSTRVWIRLIRYCTCVWVRAAEADLCVLYVRMDEHTYSSSAVRTPRKWGRDWGPVRFTLVVVVALVFAALSTSHK